MDVVSSSETTEARFALYGKELREFFASHQLPCGSPQDVVLLAESLCAPSLFHEEMSSMLRSILYREKGNVPRTQFLELVVTTVGGAHINSSAQEFHEPIRKIFDFIGSVLRPPPRPRAAGDGPHPEAMQAEALQAEGLQAQGLQAPGRSGSEPTLPSRLPYLVPAELTSAGQTEQAARTPSSGLAPRLEPALTSDRPQGATLRGSNPEPVSNQQPVPFQAPEPAGLAESARLSGAAEVPAPISPGGSFRNPSSVHSFATPISPSRSPARGNIRSTSNFGISNLGTPNLWMLGFGLLLIVLVAFLFHRHTADPTNGVTEGSRQVATGSVQPGAPRSARPGFAPSRSDRDPSNASRPSSSKPRTAVSPLQRTPDESRGQPSDPEGSGSVLAGQPSNNSQSTSSASPKPSAAVAPQEDAVSVVEPSTPNRQASSDALPLSPPSSNPAPPRVLRSPRGTRYKGLGTFSVSSGVMASNLVSASPPEYPRLARLTHIQGQVILQVVVSRSGTVVDTHVLSGHRILRGAAIKAVRRWRYRPYLVQGHPTDVATIVTVDFSLPH